MAFFGGCFSENNSKLRNINEYVKQCVIVTNKNNEKEVWINYYCKDFHIKKEFKYNQIENE